MGTLTIVTLIFAAGFGLTGCAVLAWLRRMEDADED